MPNLLITWSDLDTELSHTHHRAAFLALLPEYDFPVRIILLRCALPPSVFSYNPSLQQYNSLHIVSVLHKTTWEGNHLISHLHLLGLHLSVETMAILVSLSCSSSCCFFFGGILLPLSNAKDLPWAWSVISIKEEIQDTEHEEEV